MSNFVIAAIAAIAAFFLSVIEAKISKNERSHNTNFKISGLVFAIVWVVTLLNTNENITPKNIGKISTGSPNW